MTQNPFEPTTPVSWNDIPTNDVPESPDQQYINLPRGKYDMVVDFIEKSATATGDPIMKVTGHVVTPQGNATITDMIWLSAWKAKYFVKACGVELGKNPWSVVCDQCIGKVASKADIGDKVSKEGKTYHNNVYNYYPAPTATQKDPQNTAQPSTANSSPYVDLTSKQAVNDFFSSSRVNITDDQLPF